MIEMHSRDEELNAIHMGYVDWLFKSRRDAADFFCRHTSGQVEITEAMNWTSDWSPLTQMRCVIRQTCDVCTGIEHCRESIPGQRQALEHLNRAIREENNKNENWPRVKLPEEEAEELRIYTRRNLRSYRIEECDWADHVLATRSDSKHLKERMNRVCGDRSSVSYQGSVLVAQELLELGAIPTIDNLLDAITRGYHEIVELLLEDGRVQPRTNKRTLLEACRMGHTKIARLLIGHCNWDRDVIEEAASQEGRTQKLLLSHL